ncbi:YdcF family protein [Paraburkholderia bonniea]|uniref:YdcF family protein n=1 Tax=Paraburkholderia bonniea TaxID=2152891 RepID=UPI002573E9AA|nr:YdcF family protein [Paraburkholderia bonniea]WJF89067.1 YdcF family protein [Paraburkholderia bonniea]WJF92383.1 YdcF family protein [Paraburkholderia bonniea]
MTLIVLVILIVFAIGCAALAWRRTSVVLYALTAVLFLAIGCGPVPAWLLGQLQDTYDIKPRPVWGKRNALVLLGAGTTKVPRTGAVEPGMFAYARIAEAAALYNDCRRKTVADCKIIVSGGDALHLGSPEAIVYQRLLVRLGVSAADVMLEPGSMNTWQNAQFTSALLQRYAPDRVLLVSSGLHLQRSLLYFGHFGVHAMPVRADYLRPVLTLIPLSYNFAVTDFALHEYLGIARYTLYNALGWNAVSKQPGEA